MNDKNARDAIKRRRRKLIVNSLEIMLGDLVAMDGVPATREVLTKFLEQLEMNT
jgi:hypothetical protein